MTLLTDITNYIDAQTTLTKGTDLFIGTLPANVDNCVGIFQSGGVEPTTYIDIIKPTIQVIVRNTNYETAQQLAYEVYDLMHQIYNTTLGGTYLYTIFALQEPTDIGEDETGRAVFTGNYVLEVRN
jgi:hypothetical protein